MVKLNLEGCNKEYLIDEDGNIFDIKENKYRKPSIALEIIRYYDLYIVINFNDYPIGGEIPQQEYGASVWRG